MKERKATPRKPRTTRDLATFSAGAVDTSQVVNRYTTRSRPDVELVARAISGSYYAACNLLATVMASQTMRLYRPESATSKVFAGVKVQGRKRLDWLKGQGTHRPGLKGLALAGAAGDCEEVLDHPALWTLYKPMDGMTFAQMVWQLYFWQEATGRAYSWMGKSNPPAVLFPMAPQFTNVIGSKTAGIAGYRYGRDTTDAFNIDPAEMLYFRERIHPSDPLGAVSWAHSVTMPSDMENAAFQAEIRRWENGGMPGMVIEAIGTPTEDQKTQIQQNFERQYRGVNKAGKTLFLWNGKPSQVGVKPHELGFKEGFGMTAEYIFRAAGIPDTVWKMADANKASAVMGDPQFMAMRILPAINSLAEKLTEEYLSKFEGTDGWWFAYDNPVAEDEKALQEKVAMLTDKGLATGNEGRAMLSMEPGGPELDVLRWQGTPLSIKDAPPPAPTLPGKEPEDDPDPDTGGNERFEAGAVGTETADEQGEKPGDDGAGAKAAAGVETTTRVDAHSLTCACGKHTGKKAVSDAQAAFERSLQQWMDRAVREATMPGVDAFSPENVAELERLVDTGLRSVFREGAQEVLTSIDSGEAFQLIDQEAATYARERAAEMVTGVTETLRGQIRDVIADGFIEGDTLNELRDKLEASGIAQNRTEAIVRTETSLATQGAARRTYAAAGWQGKRWDVAGGPCPLCEAIAAQYGDKVIPIEQPYYNAGESIVGLDGKVYTFAYPVMDGMAHPNCVLPHTNIAGGSAFAAMRGWYSGNVVAVRTKLGRELTVTENHRILTGRGWMKAGSIRKGENLVGAGRVDVGLSLPHENDRPPTIEQVFRTLREAGAVSSNSVPASAEHLHGDGRSINGQIEVVSANGLLMRDGDAARAQKLCETAFNVGDSKLLGLPRECSLDTLLLCARLASDGIVTGARQAKALLGCGASHANVHGLAASALAAPDRVEGLDDGTPHNPELLGECLDALAPFGVELDEVVSVESLPYSGHVYDLSTVSGAYVSNGIISHNCRCSSIYEETMPENPE